MADQFEKYAEALKTREDLISKLSDDKKLEIYGLFKQGTVGDCNTSRPGMLDFKGKAKWDSWESKKGMTCDAAKEAYITKAAELVSKYSQ